jgi:preprotein translocase subunit SecB
MMADDGPSGGGAPGDGASGEAGREAGAARPQMSITGQYLKDLSFESPNVPASIASGLPMPKIDVNVDVQAQAKGDDSFEVVLRITANASRESGPVFVAEVLYAGLFSFQNMPKEAIHAACLIECPRLLFPYARRVVSDITRDGGFPPLLLDPIDFTSLYRQQMELAQAAKQAATAPKN